MTDEVISALETLLERERSALMAGELTALAGFARRKERLVQRLARTGDPAHMARLEAALQRNGALLAASAEGLRAGIARLRALATPMPLGTYDVTGRRHELAASRSEVIRRA